MRRRTFLAAAAAGSLAGCSESDGGGPPAPTPTPEGSEFRGPDGEDRARVDLKYRDYTDEEVEVIKDAADELGYQTVLRDSEDYVGDPVTFTGMIGQVLESDEYFVFFIAANNSAEELLYASWVGDRFSENDRVECWGQVLGTEIYNTSSGSENTVPAIALADIQLLEE